MQVARYLFAGVAVLFLVGVLVQVFLAGMAVFGEGTWSTHVDFGYAVGSVPLLLLLLAWPARVGRGLVWLSVATLIVAQVQTALPLAKEALPVVAALHPVNALLVFGLGVIVARRSVAMASGREASPAAADSPGKVPV
jgi:hypothetical protein